MTTGLLICEGLYMLHTFVEAAALMCVLTAFLCWFGIVYYFFRTSLEIRGGVTIWDFLFGHPGNLMFRGSNLTEKGRQMRRRMIICILGFLLCGLACVGLSLLEAVAEGVPFPRQ
jgi:hypothetical protein